MELVGGKKSCVLSVRAHNKWLLPGLHCSPCDAILPCSLKHVVADHCVVVQDDRVVGLDEAHAAHVCCKVEHMVAAVADLLAVLKQAQVHQVELVAELVLLLEQRQMITNIVQR